jgi:hypothetical protein
MDDLSDKLEAKGADDLPAAVTAVARGTAGCPGR